MKNRKQKRVAYQFASFLIPFMIFLLFIFCNHANFQDLLISDAGEQYAGLFQYLKEILDGEKSLFYSFSKGLGGSMYGTFFYYLSSPLNLLLFFVPKQYVLDFLGFLMIFKISLSGCSMFYYLKDKNCFDFVNLILSLSYACMSYHVIYYFNVMWLDAIHLLPLVIKGLDRILDNKKSISYIIWLFIIILSNYYIAYMVCIFLVLYFCYRIFTVYSIKNDKKVMVEILKKFIVSSFFTGLLASFMLFPIIYELKGTVRELLFYGGDTLWNRAASAITQMGIQRQTIQASYSVPYFFCGFFVFAIIINYLFTSNKEIGKKSFCIMLIIFFLSMIFKPLILVWHGFTYPILFTNRWTFVLSFFLIVIASEKYQYLKNLPLRKIVLITLAYLSVLAISYLVVNEKIDLYLIFINGFFCIANLWLLNIILTYRSSIYKLALLIFFLLEIMITMKFNFILATTFNQKNDLLSYEKITNLNKELNRVVDDGYRIGGKSIYQKNELLNTNYSRVEHFLSSVNGRITLFLKQSGYSAASSDFCDHKNQEVMNSLLGIRYWYQEQPTSNYKEKDLLKLDKKIPIYENKSVPTFGYLVDKKEASVNMSNPFTYQNSFLKSIGYDSIFKKEKVIKLKNNEYKIETNGEKVLYFYITEKGNTDYPKKIILNNQQIKEKYFTFSGILKVPVDASIDTYQLKIDGRGTIEDVVVYSLNEAELVSILKTIKKKEVFNVKAKKNILRFDISVKDEQSTLLLTIPYEKGWHIFVDNKPVSYKNFFNTFIELELKEGKHHIAMYYVPFGLHFGFLISIFSLIGTILYVKRK